MSSEDSILIAIRLLCTLIIIGFTVTITRSTGDSTASKISVIHSLGTSPVDGHLKSVNNTVASGAEVISIIDEYRLQIPILLITGELYYSNREKFSYDVDKILDRRSPEYINPNLEYIIRTHFNQKDEPDWISVVQLDISDKEDLATVKSTKNEYENIFSKIKLKKTLIQEQYAKYISVK